MGMRQKLKKRQTFKAAHSNLFGERYSAKAKVNLGVEA